MILGIDAGNNEVKVMSRLGVDKFNSSLGEYRERNFDNEHSRDDMVYEYEGRKGFAGTLASIESDFGGSMLGDSKVHEDTLIRVLLAIHRNSNDPVNRIIVGQPIGTHTKADKEALKEMLKGRHTITVNGDTKSFFIADCGVAAEGGAAFWSAPVGGLVRVIDIGSGTVNCASLIDKRYFDRESYTLPFGMNTNKSNDLSEMAKAIARQTSKKWKKDDTVLLAGGGSEPLLPYIRNHYPKAELIQPRIKSNGGIRIAEPIYANAVGFYNIGVATYGN